MATMTKTERNRARRHAARDRRAFERDVETIAVHLSYAQKTPVNSAIRIRAREIAHEWLQIEADMDEEIRLENERLEAERLEAERLEAERLEAEQRTARNRARRHAARDRRAARRREIEELNAYADAVVADEEHEAAVEDAVQSAHEFLDGNRGFDFNLSLLPFDLLAAVIVRQVMTPSE